MTRRRRLEHARAAAIVKRWKPDTIHLQAVWDGARIGRAFTDEIRALLAAAWLLPETDRLDLVWLRNWSQHRHGRRLRRPPAPRFEPF